METGEHDIRHEPTDVEARPLLRLALVVGAVLVLTALALLPLFSFYEWREARQDQATAPLAPTEKGREFPTPRLQERPFADIRHLRAKEEQVSGSYGWVDQGAGVVRIPIKEAMKLTAQRGLPVREASPPPQLSPSPSHPAAGGVKKK